MTYFHPTGKLPKRVALVAAGPSYHGWTDYCAGMTLGSGMPDEVWTINTMSRGIRADVTFMLDDYMTFRSMYPDAAKWFEQCPHPVITSIPRPNCPTAIAFPLGEVMNLPGARPFLNHTVAYCIAYAILIGVENLTILGADYIAANAPYKTGQEQQQGAARYLGCASYWIGIAAARGMNVEVSADSPLLDADAHPETWFYGYLVKPRIEKTVEPQESATVLKAVS